MFTPSDRTSCGAVVDDNCKSHLGVVVPIPVQLLRSTVFVKLEVASSEPTVNCEVVAMRLAPVASETIMELTGNEDCPVPPDVTARGEIRVKTPALENDDVAVPPNQA